MEVYEVWELGVRCPNRDAIADKTEFRIKLYGPSGASAYYVLHQG